MTAELPFRSFGCDYHYYEAVDAFMATFTRHIEPAYRKRVVQRATIDGRTRLLVRAR
jgi:hypothetical protein